MSDKKISQLTQKNVPEANDLAVVVDSSDPTSNKKITLGTLPISTDTQTALNLKLDTGLAVLKSDYTSHSILAKQSGSGDPAAFTVGNNTIVGRKSGGGSDIEALSVSEVKIVLNYTPSDIGAQPALGFTPEDVANKEITALDTSTTKYPSNSVVKAAVDLKANLAGGNSFTGAQQFGDGVINRFTADVVTVSTFPYTIQASDNGKILRFNTGTDNVVNLPNNLLAGFNIAWSQSGIGSITFTPASGATMNNRQMHTKTAAQHAMGSLVVMTNSGTDAMYNLSGDTQA